MPQHQQRGESGKCVLTYCNPNFQYYYYCVIIINTIYCIQFTIILFYFPISLKEAMQEHIPKDKDIKKCKVPHIDGADACTIYSRIYRYITDGITGNGDVGRENRFKVHLVHGLW